MRTPDMRPTVSIIVPTFNRLRLLQKTLASVFKQTFEDWELLIADDGSGAATRAYLESLDDPRVRVLWLTHSGRPAVARNAALREAKGEYVAFIDSDDLWTPEKLQHQMAALRRQVTRRWSYTRFILVDESGNPTDWQRTHSWPVLSGWIFDNLVRSDTVIAVPSVVVSRELLEQVGGFDEDLVMCEDYDLWLKLAARSEVDTVDEPCTLVTRHDQHSGNEIISFQDCARVFQKVLRTRGTDHLHPVVHEKLAEIAQALARSYAARGERIRALRALTSGVRHYWRYRHWWAGALRATACAVLPPTMVAAARKRRSIRRAPGGAWP